MAYLILRDRSAAEDVVVDTLLAALGRGEHLRDEEALRPWLLRIATNRALSVRRSNARVITLQVLPERAEIPRNDDAGSRSLVPSSDSRSAQGMLTISCAPAFVTTKVLHQDQIMQPACHPATGS